MVLSKCCKHQVFVYSANEGTSFYVCDQCQRACDTIDSLTVKDDLHDARHEVETSALTDPA
jgi:hypothetical protein